MEKNMVLGWDDVIEDDGQEFVILEEGDYNFRVIDFERGRFPGGAKVPACNKATITVVVEDVTGRATIKFDLLLYRSVEWKISSFFRCIGQKKHGEKLVMDWNSVVGSYGRGHIIKRTYVNSYGEEKTVNDITKFYDYDPSNFGGDDSDLSEVDLPF